MLPEEEILMYKKVGKIARNTLNYAISLIKGKRKINMFSLAEKIEKFILENGCRPAFPCNIGINEIAAHYTPLYPEENVVLEHGIIKIDVGVHINGYIADTAISIPLSNEFKDITEFNKEILDIVIDKFRPGVKLGEIGGLVKKLAEKNGYKPISNLTGHLINRYQLHAGKHVPNVPQLISPRIETGEVYAIEPFLTFSEGDGKVTEVNDTRIYSLIRIKKIKEKGLETIRKYIFNSYNKLPFTPRWLVNVFGKEVISYIHEMEKKKFVRGYPILVEGKGAYVSQFEHTVIVLQNETLVIT